MFLDLVKDDNRFTLEQKTVLHKIYSLKQIADYETGEGSEVPQEKAAESVKKIESFILHIRQLLSITDKA